MGAEQDKAIGVVLTPCKTGCSGMLLIQFRPFEGTEQAMLGPVALLERIFRMTQEGLATKPR